MTSPSNSTNEPTKNCPHTPAGACSFCYEERQAIIERQKTELVHYESNLKMLYNAEYCVEKEISRLTAEVETMESALKEIASWDGLVNSDAWQADYFKRKAKEALSSKQKGSEEL